MFTQTLMFNFPPHFRSFFQLVGDIEELREKEYDDTQGKGKKGSREFKPVASEEFQVSCNKGWRSHSLVTCQDIELTGLQVVATLGVGGFGRVELVKVKY